MILKKKCEEIMKILLDETKMPLSGPFDNLEEILQEIIEHQINEEKTIWTVRLNGENYRENEPHDARQIKAGEIETLEIETKDRKEICRSFLENSGVMFDNLSQCLEKISRLFRMAEEKEANRHFINFLESYQDLVEMLRQCEKILELDFQKNLVSLGKLSDEIIAAQEKEDWIMLADLLEYELAPALREWPS